MSEINKWKSDDNSSGYSVETPNGSVVKILTEPNTNNTITPRMWVESIPQNELNLDYEERYKVIEEAEGEALEILSSNDEISNELSDWCKKTFEMAETLYDTLKNNNFQQIDITIDNVEFTIVPMVKSGTVNGVESLKDIEYYLIDDDIIQGDSSIYDIAEKLVNYDSYVKEHENYKDYVQDFYEQKVFPYKDLPYSELTEEQQEDRNIFSDMHKDAYGHRPHDDSRNECYQKMITKETESNLKISNQIDKER